MIDLTPENVAEYLIRQGRLPAGESPVVEMLTGGVSNVVFLVTPPHGVPFVLKQSRTQLRTQADWFSRLDRIFRETEAQRAFSACLPAGTVPAVLFEDRDNYLYAMSAVRPDHVVWKRQLLSGQIDHAVFARAGELLSLIHTQTAGRTELLAAPHDTTVFYELRIDPFYRRIAAVYPALQPKIERLIDQMGEQALCLVHADYSPKNLLIHADGMTLVDYETVHYGDPAFDLGFFFSHLWLKAVALPAVREPLIVGIQSAWDRYKAQVVNSSAPTAIDFGELSRRSVLHLAACLLARVDGKSPVDYLGQECQRALVRRLSLGWFEVPPADLDDAFERCSRELTDRGI